MADRYHNLLCIRVKMTFVVTDSCIQCKYTDCVNVCPMNCFMEGPNFLVINPDECIDCSICVPECPVDAIVGDKEVTSEQAHFIQINRDLSRHPEWKRITQRKQPLPGHEQWAPAKNKLAWLVKAEELETRYSEKHGSGQALPQLSTPD